MMYFDVSTNVCDRRGRWTPVIERVEADSYTGAIMQVYLKWAAECRPGGSFTSYQVISAARVDDEGEGPRGEVWLDSHKR